MPHGHLERDLVQRRAVVVVRGVGRRQPGPDRDGLAEAHVRRAARGPPLGPGVLGQPLEALGLLLAAGLLGGHRGDLVQPVVGDRGRHQVDVLDATALDGLGDVAEQPVARAADLAGARAAALEVPLQVEALGQQEREVLLDHGLVDLVVAEAAADEHDAGPPRQVADRPDAEVGAAHHVVAREVVAGEHVAEDERVDVRAVGRQEHQRVALVELPQPGQSGLVGEHLPRRGVQRPHHRVEHVHGRAALDGHQLVEALLGLLQALVDGQAHLGRDLGDLVAELLARQDLLADGVRHLVAVADLRALLALEGHHGRSADERAEGVGARVASPSRCRQEALAELAEQGGLAGEHAASVGGEGRQPSGEPGGRALRRREQGELGEPGRTGPALDRRQPREPDRDDEGVLVRRQGRTQALAGPRHGVEDGLDGWVLLGRPGVDDGSLDGRGLDRDGDHRHRIWTHTRPFVACATSSQRTDNRPDPRRDSLEPPVARAAGATLGRGSRPRAPESDSGHGASTYKNVGARAPAYSNIPRYRPSDSPLHVALKLVVLPCSTGSGLGTAARPPTPPVLPTRNWS